MRVKYDDEVTERQVNAIAEMLETEFREGEWVMVEYECSRCGGKHPFVALPGGAKTH